LNGMRRWTADSLALALGPSYMTFKMDFVIAALAHQS